MYGRSGQQAQQRSCATAHGATQRWRQAVRAAAAFPPALLVVTVGVAVTLVDTPDVLRAVSFGPAMPTILNPAASDWWPAFSRAALPQLPVRRRDLALAPVSSQDYMQYSPLASRRAAGPAELKISTNTPQSSLIPEAF